MDGVMRKEWDPNEETDDSLSWSSFPPSATPSRVKQIWSVGGGKGGVGKSLISSSLALSLARQGNKVIALDLDLGGANLHTTLGIDQPKKTLSDFFSGKAESLENCVVPTPIANLHVISGADDSLSIANLAEQDKNHFLKKVRELDADYLVFDLGAGTGAHTIDFFLYSDVGIITLLPEPTSIENGYRFIRTAYYRRLMNAKSLTGYRELIEAAQDPKNSLKIQNPTDLYHAIARKNPEGARALQLEVSRFCPKLIINQTRTQADADVGHSVKTICKKYFGIEVEYLGALDYDSAVWQAVRRRRPLLIEFPNSKLSNNLDRMTRNLLKPLFLNGTQKGIQR